MAEPATEYWHVRIEAKNGPSKAKVFATDKTRDWIEQRILEPRRRGVSIAIQGRELAWTRSSMSGSAFRKSRSAS